MTDCSSIHGSSSSSDITSSRGSSNPRIRVIRLTRPQYHQTHAGNPSFGFSLRGGREYGTGFFISRVEKGSEADVQGLRVFLNLFSLFFSNYKSCFVLFRLAIRSSKSMDITSMMLFTKNYPNSLQIKIDLH